MWIYDSRFPGNICTYFQVAKLKFGMKLSLAQRVLYLLSI
jgi:hypothetical protein